MKIIIYSIGLLLLVPGSIFSQDTLQQKKLRLVLREIKKPKGENENLFLFTPQDYNDNGIKQRVLDLLMNQWGENEIKAWIDDRINIEGYISYREVNAEKINRNKKVPYEKALDSIRSVQVEEIKKFVADKPVSNKIILLAGWLDMQEAISVLKHGLQDPVHYNKEAIELSLARLRVEPFHSDFVKKYSRKKKIKDDVQSDFFLKAYRLLYISSPESIDAVIKDWLFRDDKVQPYADDPFMVPVANYLALELVDFIKNADFKNKYPDGIFISPASIKKEQLNAMRKWINQNKSKIEPNRNYFNLYTSGIPGL